MDTTDLKIINHLKNHGRATIKEIGSVVNLSSPAVTERVKRLEENGLIKGYQAEIDYAKLGKAMQAFVAVDVEPKKYENFCAFCQETPAILSHFHIIGPHNAMLHVAITGSEELSQLLSKIQFYGVSQTSVILNRIF